MIHRRRLALACTLLLGLSGAACVSPFGGHAQDTRDSIAADASEAHRRWDRYFLGFDWDDPYHDWHDEAYARGPMHRR